MVFEDTTATLIPIQVISKKDARKVAMPAMKPITGGPIMKPEKPMVDTAVSATPGDISDTVLLGFQITNDVAATDINCGALVVFQVV